MVSFAPTSDGTREDQRLYTEARMVEVACQDCLAVVRVKKNSDHHTSVQWSTKAQQDCQEFNRSGAGERAVHQPCSRLRRSIAQAVEDGTIQIGAEDGY
ncbi:hypothetical protein [Nocardioides massiliensis]|uniref:Ferredoxin n=1 Tax=Nocardioides massiliensis TaxID=1325935 RepID=A0ABT9NSX0_9ACTN|nr:hypothetical protein [Nocardioides massiliensis]MDP9823140.1 hypothetical protein [Nocardioides massiliensis]